MKLIHKRLPLLRAGALLLLLSLLLSLVSCGGDPVIIKEGLDILDPPAVRASDEAISEGEAVLYELFLYAVEKNTDTVPSGLRKRIGEHAAEMAVLIAESGIAEESYLAVLAILEENGRGVINEYCDGSTERYPRFRSLYLSLSAHLSAERLCSLAYETVLYSYDYRLGLLWQRYDSYGYSYLKEEYDALTVERDTFLSQVGRESFAAALRTLLMLSDLFAEAEGDTALLADFTPAELLVFLRFIPLEQIRVSPKGFELLLSLVASNAGGDAAMLLAVADRCGDLPLLADKMEGLLGLLVHMRDAMEKADALLLQNGETDALLSSLFASLSDEEWALLDSIAELPLDRAAYDTAAREHFGEAYIAYAAALTPITAAELRAGVGSDGFAALLPRYLGSVSPALAYLIEQ